MFIFKQLNKYKHALVPHIKLAAVVNLLLQQNKLTMKLIYGVSGKYTFLLENFQVTNSKEKTYP